MDDMADLTTEIAAYKAIQDELESTHLHEWVVFHGETLLGTFDSLEGAAVAAEESGREPYLIRQVGSPIPRLPTSVLFRPVYAHR